MGWGCVSVRDLTLLLVAIAAGSVLLTAQVEIPNSGGRAAAAVRTEHAPRLDGTLNDPIWQTAPPIADFRQREPLETSPPTEKTEVRMLYDARIFISASTAMTSLPLTLLPPSCVEICPWTWTITLPS